jgi:hypothetical protein
MSFFKIWSAGVDLVITHVLTQLRAGMCQLLFERKVEGPHTHMRLKLCMVIDNGKSMYAHCSKSMLYVQIAVAVKKTETNATLVNKSMSTYSQISFKYPSVCFFAANSTMSCILIRH